MDFTIDPEVRDLLPAGTDEENELLAADLAATKRCRDALVLGKYPGLDKPVLIDGHRRHYWCERLGIPYDVGTIKDFASREKMLQWMIDNQLARRNLTDLERAYYRGKDYLLARQSRGGDRVSDGASGQDGPSVGDTAEAVADKHSVSPRTVKRDAKFAAAVDAIAAKEPEKKQEILHGESGQTKVEVIASVKPKARKKPRKTPEDKQKAEAEKDWLRGDEARPESHPYQELLNTLKATAAKLSKAVNDAPKDSKLRDYLVYCGIMRPRDIIIDGKKYGWQCVFLRGAYRVVNLAGKRGRLDKRQVTKAYNGAVTGEE